ncbi:hypothetical protein TCAL_00252 [Tigriopus californicus]|uniref:Endoplasmic reticulum vesicle transporter C-terminal domain-containing protein n=1 Tax=Tigriopus californicus TaxID=6832 RepID=A0A553P378_TIGCA|nr:endoplasmic reticulum-Golgi intermediate compartment protein 2-like [Tigriopus californicus]TRY72158.1 hypothetical protein TCAL_00252 [Tigriopus californicus]|eukprot:TCALIF_00252-PB protein Name:"Similar to ergic2 Endoplasmic reticulum-Golgi intermediate compartment protein 2 (Danio rerio)" AED:0.01 eAED:0.01 QI:2084/1/1/1/0.8/0.66/6/106/399
MVLRQRKNTNIQKVVQELDAFPKVPETFVEQTTSGASISVVTFLLVTSLLWSELAYFWNPGFRFKFTPDSDFESKLTINVDMTVAMPCDMIGADILDSTNQNTFSFGRLKEEPTWFELDHLQRNHFEAIQTFNEYLREGSHSIQDVLWKSGQSTFFGEIPPRRSTPEEPHDACRVHGSLSLNKVAGNFHITAGKSVPLMGGHAHLTAFMGPQDYNFSHRIDKFSFGSPHGGVIQPLEGDEKIADKNMMNFQYFIQVIPTEVQMVSGFTYPTYQYSVKEQLRPIDHTTGSHGVSGIYFKYDVNALKVLVIQDREPLWQFLVRLCAGIGGLVATSQMVCGLIQALVRFYCCPDIPEKKQSNVSGMKTVDLIPPQERVAPGAERHHPHAVTLDQVQKLIHDQ